MIAAHGLTKTIGQRTLWEELDFTVNSGEMMAVRGPSGSGKSTLLNCLGLLEPLTAGHVLIQGANTTTYNQRQQRIFRRDTLGYLFQNYALIENTSIHDNLTVAGGENRKLSRTEKHKVYEEALEHVGLTGRSRDLVYELSGGEQQRVALARLLVKKPGFILADEPTGALDDGNADMVISTLRYLAEKGASILIATHNDHVESRCDTSLVLESRALVP